MPQAKGQAKRNEAQIQNSLYKYIHVRPHDTHTHNINYVV
jgi:hypothetical protein